jgi:hypothetical protein
MRFVDVRRENRCSHPMETALAAFRDERSVCDALDPGFIADGKRNVPPERDVEPTILSPAELCGSIHPERRAMQPHSTPIDPTRTTHVR